MTLPEVIATVPAGCRWNVGHTPRWYRKGELPPKNLRYEAYVLCGDFGTKSWIMESADGATPEEALSWAVAAVRLKLGKTP